MSLEIEKYSWDQYQTDIVSLSQWIKASGREFECIVGLARGGLIPAVQLSHELNLPLITLTYQTRDGTMKDSKPIPANALIVDDINDTGKTLSEVTKLCEGKYTTVVLYDNDESEFNVDFWMRKNYNKWISFPWENK